MPDTAIMAWIPAPTTRSSGAIIAVDAGRARFTVEDGPADLPTPLTHLITDVFGYFT
jgi:hypothetical protein